MKQLIALLISGFLFGACQPESTTESSTVASSSTPVAQATPSQQAPVTVHSPGEFAKAWEKAPEGALLVDVRTPPEYAQGSLEGAKNFDVKSSDFAAQFADIPRDQPIYLFCKRGGRSARAASTLEELGFTAIHDMKGGYTAWKAEGRPVTNPD